MKTTLVKTKLTQSEKEDIIPHVRMVLETGEPWENERIHHPAGILIDAILEIEGMKKREKEDSDNGEGFSTNGWQWDWWQDFTCNGKNYTLSGSGYEGGHSFFPSDD